LEALHRIGKVCKLKVSEEGHYARLRMRARHKGIGRYRVRRSDLPVIALSLGGIRPKRQQTYGGENNQAPC
jgi:hypothetical protein